MKAGRFTTSNSSIKFFGHLAMGAPKQKWTAEEETALKAGIAKHGAGKWRTILKDPEFSGILCLRSNVDLKDKWRNMSVTTNGWGSRERVRVSLKKSQPVHKHDESSLANTSEDEDFDDEIVEAKPLALSSETWRNNGPKRSIPRLENLIFEAITNLRDPTGSNMTAIAMYIEDNYWSPPDFERALSMKLKMLTASGKLIKVKRKYRIAQSSGVSENMGSRLLALEGRKKEFTRLQRDDISTLTKSQIDIELAKMRNMTTQEAAAAAARAVEEAEAAMAEAEEAAREAEIAEADAEAAQEFAVAAMTTLRKRSAGKLMVRGTET